MNASLKWLNEYININVSTKEFCDAMTMSGSKVEGFEDFSKSVSNVVIGKIISIEKHPDAEKLVVCQIDANKGEQIQIVTGATNVFPGAIIPVALDGAILPNGLKIKKTKLRGIESNGMLCSVGELNLTVNDFPGADPNGILILDESYEIGADGVTALGLDDTCVEFEITSNRPDCLSILGLAREAAATFDLPLNEKLPKVETSGGNINDYINVEIKNTQLCKRYIARVAKNIKIEPSPAWLRQKLRVCGVRPINNLVDITNYVMLEYGQPMHAFDLRFIEGNKIVVRNAEQNEKITTLDEAERELNDQNLIIADDKKAIAVAGVMGGLNSEIKDDTTTVVFEAACFDGASVRKTAKQLGLRTESSARFEKGLDASIALLAINRACELVNILGAGEIVEGIIDCNYDTSEPFSMELKPDNINKFLGTDISEDEMKKILKSLSFEVNGNTITAPRFRIDIEGEHDVSEEIARIFGYNNIPSTPIKGVAEGKYNERQVFEKMVANCLTSTGCFEVVTYSFFSKKQLDKICLPQNSELRNCVEILNPLGEETAVMRTTTIPSILEVLSKNFNNSNKQAWIYEIGKEYLPKAENELPTEQQQITIGMYSEETDFYTIKGVVEAIFETIKLNNVEFCSKSDDLTFHPGRCAVMIKDGVEIGIIGEVHPKVLENYDIGTKAYIAKIDFNKLYEAQKQPLKYKKLPKFPATTRDLSLVCKEELEVGTIEKAIKNAAGKLLEDVALFDVYRSNQLGEGIKSVSYSITLRSYEATLTEQQIETTINKILKALTGLGVEIRG